MLLVTHLHLRAVSESVAMSPMLVYALIRRFDDQGLLLCVVVVHVYVLRNVPLPKKV